MQHPTSFYRALIVLLILFILSGITFPSNTISTAIAQTTGVTFTYQGQLDQGDAPAQGSCDFRFKIYRSKDDTGAPVDTFEDKAVQIDNGLFTASLENIDFGPRAFIEEERWLEISVSCPSGLIDNYSTLNPRQRIMLVPAAAYALSTAPVPWRNLENVPPGLSDGDNDTTYAAGSGLQLTNGTFSLDPSVIAPNLIQRRINGTCAPNSSIRIIKEDGTVECEPDTDTNTTYSAGNGLRLSGGVFSLPYYDRGGLTVNNAGWDGFTARNPTASGLYVENAQIDGVHISNPKEDGVQINNAGRLGVGVWNAELDGYYIENHKRHGLNIVSRGDGDAASIHIQGPGKRGIEVSNEKTEFAALFLGTVQIQGQCIGCQTTIFGYNSGQVALELGDIVTIHGIRKVDFNVQPILDVNLVGNLETVLGVVTGSATLSNGIADTTFDSSKVSQVLVPQEGPAQPGDYVTIVTNGLAQVKTNTTNTNIQPGTLLITADQAGKARMLDAEARATAIDRTGTIIGTALEASTDSQELVWVLVNPR